MGSRHNGRMEENADQQAQALRPDDAVDGDVGASPSRLTATQLALEAGASSEYVRRLAGAGAIRPDAAGLHEIGDVPRVRLARTLADGGIDVDGLMWAIETGLIAIDRVADLWTLPESTGRTFGEFAASLGRREGNLAAIYAAFGLAVPAPETVMRIDEEAVVTEFLELWSLVDDREEVHLRAAHIAGDGVRRIQEATLDLFDEIGGSPPQRLRRGLSWDDAVRPSVGLTPMMTGLLEWLEGRHAEHELFGRIVTFVEAALAQRGPAGSRDEEPPAIAFVDLSSYTELTATVGDEHAAHVAASLQTLAERAVRGHRGRVVKVLGDGVMLRFAAAAEAVDAVRALMEAIVDSGLPPAHAGIVAGPIVVRDGDVFGHTVNLASRIASHGSAGDLLIPQALLERIAAASVRWEDAGEANLKGVTNPVHLVRVLLGPPPGNRDASPDRRHRRPKVD
jgi:adenylate cyclase